MPSGIGARLDPAPRDRAALNLPPAIRGGRDWEAAEPGRPAEAAAGRSGGFWRRGASALVDAVLAGGLALLAGMGAVLAAAEGGELAGRLDPATDLLAAAAALVAMVGGSFAYHVLCTGAWGRTPGKRLFGLTVARAEGGALGYGRAAWRWVASWLALAPLGVGLLLVAVMPGKRGLHDLLAGTVVLCRSPDPP